MDPEILELLINKYNDNQLIRNSAKDFSTPLPSDHIVSLIMGEFKDKESFSQMGILFNKDDIKWKKNNQVVET